jgi:hypothetical protein
MAAAARVVLPQLVQPFPKLLLLTSQQGSKRVSCGYVRHVLTNSRRHELVSFAPRNQFGEPSVQAAEEGAAFAKRMGCDAVVALGGGAVLDLAKGVCRLHSNAPLFAVPTLPSYGAEADSRAKLIDWERDDVLDLAGVKPRGGLVLDASLARMDKLRHSDVKLACLATLAKVWDLCVLQPGWLAQDSSREALVRRVARGMLEDDEDLLLWGMALSARCGGDEAAEEEVPPRVSWHEELTWAVSGRLPLARSLVSGALLFASMEFEARRANAQVDSKVLYSLCDWQQHDEAGGADVWAKLRLVMASAGADKRGLLGLGGEGVQEEFEECAHVALKRAKAGLGAGDAGDLLGVLMRGL